MFVRVAHRQGWDVERVGEGGEVTRETLGSRAEALEYARALAPEWIEVGDIAGLGTPEQHHRWTTLHRQADGSYAPSGLRWGGKG